MGLRAAREGCRGEVPSARPDIPPTGGFSSLFLIYPPASVQCCARADGLMSQKPNPAKLICMGFAKNGLAARNRNFVLHKADDEIRGGAPASRGPMRLFFFTAHWVSSTLAGLPALFSYTHRPRCSGRHGSTGL